MDEQERAVLRQLYPGWNIRRPATMRCMVATRMDRDLSEKEIYAGLHMTLVEDTPDLLRAALDAQLVIERTL
jgi:hypothetical protein